MTNREAIEILVELQKCYLGGIVDAIDMAIEAVNAQEPVEPVFERIFMSDIEIYDCGKCGTSLGAKGIAKYCMKCGQAVKWG